MSSYGVLRFFFTDAGYPVGPFNDPRTPFDGNVPFDGSRFEEDLYTPQVAQTVPWINSTYYYNPEGAPLKYFAREDDLYTPQLPQSISWRNSTYFHNAADSLILFIKPEDDFYVPQTQQTPAWSPWQLYFNDVLAQWQIDDDGPAIVARESICWVPATYAGDDSGEPLSYFGIEDDLFTPQRQCPVVWRPGFFTESRIGYVTTTKMPPTPISGMGSGVRGLTGEGVATISPAGQGSRTEGVIGEGSGQVGLTGKD